jgi:antitoxin VapB
VSAAPNQGGLLTQPDRGGGERVTIPLEYRFPEGMKEVFIRRVGQDFVLSPRPTDWSSFLASTARVSDDFMVNVEDLAVQERGFA